MIALLLVAVTNTSSVSTSSVSTSPVNTSTPAIAAPIRRAPKVTHRKARTSADDFEWLFAVPPPAEWMLSGAVGLALLGRASGTRSISPIYRASLRHALLDTFTLGVSADFTSDSERGAMLEASNTRTFVAANAGAYVWASRFRFSAGVEAGALLETSSLSDGSGSTNDRSNFRVRPAAGFSGAAGLAIRGVAVFELVALVRREPDHTNIALALGLDWVF